MLNKVGSATQIAHNHAGSASQIHFSNINASPSSDFVVPDNQGVCVSTYTPPPSDFVVGSPTNKHFNDTHTPPLSRFVSFNEVSGATNRHSNDTDTPLLSDRFISGWFC